MSLDKNNSLVSIVILTKNGGKSIASCLSSIYSQRTSFPFEVIAVDSGSTDDTLGYIENYPVQLYSIKPDEFAFGPTRDYAFSLTKGQYIVTLSQDVIPANENWLVELVKPLIDDKADVVQGRIIVPENGDIFFWERKGLFYFTSEGQGFISRYGNLGLSCCSVSFKREAWLNTRFGNVLMNEDKVIQKKLFENGYKIIRAYDSIAYHGHSYRLKSLKNRCENEGLGWRCAGVTYHFSQMIKDLVQKKWVYGLLVRGVLNGEIKSLSEGLFLLIRPIYLLKGNRFTKSYKNENRYRYLHI